mmetsp:Transcript_77554/g.147494  ORF Transcript_77554/g.147494 Transcript_77554/m.147494 type:complete len:1034 (-) Transcript_77554:110-3211(-)
MSVRALIILCLASSVAADLRMASQPRVGYRLRNQGTVAWNISAYKYMNYRYMEPSAFGYKGLEHQKKRNYDNFLRSNIDNEQDNRNFNTEDGKDHLPFRTYEAKVFDDYTYHVGSVFRIQQAPEQIHLTKEVKPGASMTVPLRWNNPHSSEMEVNIWIFKHATKQPIVVPIRRPSCSGEGYQDNVISFTVPKDFVSLGGQIPGFKGCSEDTKPMCVLQIYSHSVESRTYAIGFPIVIPGHDKTRTTSASSGIQDASQDPWFDLSGLRDTCLPATDPSAVISSSKPKWARLVSDVYNHAYQNSDYSPYSGQQQDLISKNLQASAINKMETGNRGELGKSILTSTASRKLRDLRRLEDRIYKNYESLANKVIKSIEAKGQMKTTGTIGVQKLANDFRCEEVGSTNTKRLQTNTYIPSFQLPKELEGAARKIVGTKYAALISDSGLVQIYVTSLKDLLPFFYKARHLGVIYQEGIVKSTIETKSDDTKFKKINKEGKVDGGKYAAREAKKKFVAERGCPSKCLWAEKQIPSGDSDSALLQEEEEHADNEADGGLSAKPSTWAPPDTMKMGGKWIRGEKPVTLKLDLGDNHWIVGIVDGRWIKMVELKITSEKDYTWISAIYRSSSGSGAICTKPATFTEGCYSGRYLTSKGYEVYPPFEKYEGKDLSNTGEKPWFCVVSYSKNWVKGPFSDVEAAKTELNKITASMCNRQMICEMSKSGAKKDPHRVGSQNQGLGTKAGFQKYWRNWGEINRMNQYCTDNDACKYNGAENVPVPAESKKSWYCVPRYHKKKVEGPFPDVESAKKELNKEKGSNSNWQMICEMTEKGVKSDPHKVGGQNQGAASRNGFNTYWRSWGGIGRLNGMCHADASCALNAPKDTIMGPIIGGSYATNVTGNCQACVQFFGKKVESTGAFSLKSKDHALKEPKVTPLAQSVAEGGRPKKMSKSDRLPDNPEEGNIYEEGNVRRRRRRRRSASLIQKGDKHEKNSTKETLTGRKHKSGMKKVHKFMKHIGAKDLEMDLSVLDDVEPLPTADGCE